MRVIYSLPPDIQGQEARLAPMPRRAWLHRRLRLSHRHAPNSSYRSSFLAVGALPLERKERELVTAIEIVQNSVIVPECA
jgi:hypothetical protein